MNEHKYREIVSKVDEIRARRGVEQRNDAATNGTSWITINGTHVPLDSKGNITGNSAAAKNIRASTGKSAGAGNSSSSAKKGAKDPKMHKAIETMSKGDIGDYLIDHGFDGDPGDEWYEWLSDKVNSSDPHDLMLLKTAAQSAAAGKIDDFKRLSKADCWDKADYLLGRDGVDENRISDLAYDASRGNKLAGVYLDIEVRKALRSIDD